MWDKRTYAVSHNQTSCTFSRTLQPGVFHSNLSPKQSEQLRQRTILKILWKAVIFCCCCCSHLCPSVPEVLLQACRCAVHQTFMCLCLPPWPTDQPVEKLLHHLHNQVRPACRSTATPDHLPVKMNNTLTAAAR